MGNDIQKSENALPSKGYSITVKQFVEENYAAKIEAGECQVFWYSPPPKPDEAYYEYRMEAYRGLVESYGNVTEIGTVEVAISPNTYYMHPREGLGTLLTTGDQILYVTTAADWKAIDAS